VILPSRLPVSFEHHCGGKATQIAAGLPILVYLGDPQRVPTTWRDLYWRERYACDHCSEVITVYEDLHVAVVFRARDLPLAS
jgi:hypothetical protein